MNGARIAARVRDALTRDYRDDEQRDANGRWVVGGDVNTNIAKLPDNPDNTERDAVNPLHDTRARFLGAYTDEQLARAPLKTIPIEDIVSYQKTVMRGRVAEYANDPKRMARQNQREGIQDMHPYVKESRIPGKYDLGNGNHRIVAALLSGQKTVDVRVLPKSARKLPDNDW